MTTKKEALKYIKTLAEQRIVTKDELNLAYDSGSGIKTTDVASSRKLGLTEILYYIGGGIVFLGITIFLWQNWSTLSFPTRLLTTLGVGIAAYFVGLLFSRDARTEAISPAFYLISALTTPIGLYVVFNHMGFDVSNYGYQSLISGILFGTYLLSYFVLRKNIFILFSILFGTWLFFSLTSFMISGSASFDSEKFFEYRFIVAGVTYMLLGYAFSKNEHNSLSGFLYNFGILGFLGSALLLGGWEPNQNVFWELIFPGLVFGTLLLSVHLKSKAFLVWSTLFLMAYISKITSEYFSSSLGWPLALVIAGLCMIGIAYMSISIKRKYL